MPSAHVTNFLALEASARNLHASFWHHQLTWMRLRVTMPLLALYATEINN